jgi:hypothetical protein
LYEDFAGNGDLRGRLHAHLGDALVYDATVGITHFEEMSGGSSELPGPKPTFFFAPDQMRKRRQDWGPGGIEKRHAEAWHEFVPTLEGWVDVVRSEGPEGLRAAWLEVLSGQSDPKVGHVIAL